jgi:hypothetical protein
MASIEAGTVKHWESRVDAARECFARTLVAWAGDTLELRRRGLDQLRWTSANPADCAVKPHAAQADGSIVPMNRAA